MPPEGACYAACRRLAIFATVARPVAWTAAQKSPPFATGQSHLQGASVDALCAQVFAQFLPTALRLQFVSHV
jgi:hypothetical protein